MFSYYSRATEARDLRRTIAVSVNLYDDVTYVYDDVTYRATEARDLRRTIAVHM